MSSKCKYYRLLSPSGPSDISSRSLLHTIMMNVILFIQSFSHLSAPDSASVFLFESRARPENNSDRKVPSPSHDLQFREKLQLHNCSCLWMLLLSVSEVIMMESGSVET